MFVCEVCFKETSSPKLKTIGDQIVCSLSCVGLLKPNNKDACDYCKRIVWRDNFYKINNKYYCSEICKDLILKQLNIPSNSKLIQYYKEDLFSNNSGNYALKNAKQLREEVFKFYKDFQFDINTDELPNNKNYTMDYSNNIRKVKTIKLDKSNITNNLSINIDNNYSNRKEKNNNTNSQISNNNWKSKFTKSLSPLNIQNKDKNNLKYLTKSINKEKIYLNKNTHYNYANRKESGEKYEIKNRLLSERNLINNISSYKNIYNNDNNQNYSFINTWNRKNENMKLNNYNTINGNNSNCTNKNSHSYISHNYNKINKVKSKENKKECMICRRKLGNVKILDRDNNAFCSDYCKDEFLKFNNN